MLQMQDIKKPILAQLEKKPCSRNLSQHYAPQELDSSTKSNIGPLY